MKFISLKGIKTRHDHFLGNVKDKDIKVTNLKQALRRCVDIKVRIIHKLQSLQAATTVVFYMT